MFSDVIFFFITPLLVVLVSNHAPKWKRRPVGEWVIGNPAANCSFGVQCAFLDSDSGEMTREREAQRSSAGFPWGQPVDTMHNQIV